jgi:hypothetical protein
MLPRSSPCRCNSFPGKLPPLSDEPAPTPTPTNNAL